MNRLWIFPLVVGFFGALLPVLAVEGIAPLLFIPGLSISPTPPEMIPGLLKVMLGGFVIGALLGILAAMFDLARNGVKSGTGGQLAANIAWCLLYAHVFILVDMVLVFLWITRKGPTFFTILPAIWLPCVLCLVAIAWGTIRTVSAGDVLSPRVLGAKLKRSARIEG